MTKVAKPQYHAYLEPVYPCREMMTRHCPAIYDEVCGDKPCARYEASEKDVRAVWLAEIETA